VIARSLTRLAAFFAPFTMLMAMTVHLGNGLLVSNNAYDFVLSLLAITVALVAIGGGKLSADQWLSGVAKS